MKFHFSAVLAALLSTSATSFTANGPSRSRVGDVTLFATSPLSTDYLVRAHEDKLRAVSEVEKTKNAEINALKDEVNELKQKVGALAATSPSTTSGSIANESKDEVAAKLLSYQQFMAKYIVESHQQKVDAVRTAELRIAQKYEEQLRLLQASSSAPEEKPALNAAPPSVPTTPQASAYASRNAYITAAAKAGKSRWGEMETERSVSAGVGTSAPVPQAATGTVPPPPPVKLTVPPEVEAADHGLRADGGVGGYTLAERVAMGANVVNVGAAALKAAPKQTSIPTPTKPSSVFDARNTQVTAAAKAGKSRWGEMEASRAASAIGATIPPQKVLKTLIAPPPPPPRPASSIVPPEVEAADHGLRADGGVGGYTLAERVSLGANVVNIGAAAVNGTPKQAAAAPSSASSTSVKPSSVFAARNVQVAAAAKAGKSRWGEMEVERALSYTPQTATAMAEAPVPTEVVAADHGLRADGGVGGPSLRKRVNLGALLFGK